MPTHLLLPTGLPADAEPSAIQAALQRTLSGSWTIKYTCSKAASCRCPFQLELRHAKGSGKVAVWQTEGHQYHDPNSAADRAELPMHPDVEAVVMLLLEGGMKPYNVWWQVHAQHISVGTHPGGSLEAASDARWNITLPQVYAVRKKLQRRAGYGLTSDAAAVAAQMEALSELGCVLHYQPLRERCDGSGSSGGPRRVTVQCEDGLHQPLMLVLQTPFQARMLAQFGGRLAFMDATGGTNRYGYQLQGMVVSGAMLSLKAGLLGVWFACCASLPASKLHVHCTAC